MKNAPLYLLFFVIAACARTESQRCPVCGGAVVAVEQVQDDVSKPSRNIAVWNRSICGNELFGPGATIGHSVGTARAEYPPTRE